MDGLLGICFMFNLFVRLKRVLILGAFFVAAVWLAWCGETYNDRHNSPLPAIMCAVESLVLVITGAALAGQRPEREFERD
jgi:hypothetical protein